MGVKHSILVNHFQHKVERGWDKTYWAFDIHGTILKPNYQFGNIPDEYYPFAKECLQLISELPDVCMILYTCSHPHEISQYLELFEKENIHFEYVNENPEVPTQVDGYGCYDKKLYMNVLFEDKAGFNPLTEWEEIYFYLHAQYYDKISKVV
jgi:hypothetical protein